MLGTLIASLLSAEAASTVRGLRRTAIVYALAGLCLLTGAGFLTGAAYIALARRVGDMNAALWFAGGFVLAGLLALLLNKIISGVRARRHASRRSVELKTLAGAAAVALLPALMRRGPGVGLGALLAPLIGLVAYQIYRENRRPEDPDDPFGT